MEKKGQESSVTKDENTIIAETERLILRRYKKEDLPDLLEAGLCT